MVLTVFVVAIVALAATTLALLAIGHRVRFASRIVGLLLGALVALGAGELAAALWHLPARETLVGEGALAAATLLIVTLRGRWNPVAQLFGAALLSATVAYLAFGVLVTVASGLSPLASVASGVLWTLELTALFLSGSFAVESLDALCTVVPPRRVPFDASYRPMVSLQVAAYNEPPDMLIETIRSLEAIEYPRLEIVVIDNNTTDPDVWRPVEEYCEGRDRVRFVHVEDLEGYKSGALNLALRESTDPDAELVGVVDADYLVDPSYLTEVVGFFADPNVAFVQTPQDYREYRNDAYLTACYDAYRYFFKTAMPVRNRRNSIIFAGTMGLIRRAALEKVGGWDEWCITEDAEASLRMLREGLSGVFVARSFGRGIMPLTFAALKGQRFRWCFGGMQILRRHWRELLPWRSRRRTGLTFAQRTDYLLGSLQWLNDLVILGFAMMLLAIAGVLLVRGSAPLRPLLGAGVVLPGVLIASGVLRAFWALRIRTRIGVRRATLAFANWLSLSWTVALACVQGLVRREGVFLRTPKTGDRMGVLTALWTTKTETALALALWSAGTALLVVAHANLLLVGLFVWQGGVYATAPFMAWLNQHTELSAQLERRRRSEWMRDRMSRFGPAVAVGGMSALGVGALIGLLVAAGAGGGGRPFSLPERSPGAPGPLGAVVGVADTSPTTTTTVAPSPSASVLPSSSPSPTSSTAPSPTVSPSPSASPLPSPSVSPPATATPAPG